MGSSPPDLDGPAEGQLGNRVRRQVAAMAGTQPSLPHMVSGASAYRPGAVGRRAAAFPGPRSLATAAGEARSGLHAARRTWALSLRPPFHLWWGHQADESPGPVGSRPARVPTAGVGSWPAGGAVGAARTAAQRAMAVPRVATVRLAVSPRSVSRADGAVIPERSSSAG